MRKLAVRMCRSNLLSSIFYNLIKKISQKDTSFNPDILPKFEKYKNRKETSFSEKDIEEVDKFIDIVNRDLGDWVKSAIKQGFNFSEFESKERKYLSDSLA